MSDDALLRPSAFGTIVCGGLAVGVLDFLDATIFFPLWYGIRPISVWWSVASGLIGRDRAINGGLKTALLGLLLHFLIATIMAAVFYGASLLLPTLIRHPVVWGMIYGVVCYFVMTFVVVPWSRVPPSPRPVIFTIGMLVVKAIPRPIFLNGIIGHALLVGLPIALCARRSAKAR